MSKAEFLSQLREALRGNVSQGVINDNLNYYDNYILQELRKGKTEEDIIQELGNPRMLAQTIIDTAEKDRTDAGNSPEGKDTYEENAYDNGNNYGDYGRYNKVITGRKAKWLLAIIVLAILLVIVGIGLLIGGLISVVAPFLLPLILIMLAIRLMGRRR